jgi:tRNA(fMet)-specific endonuclease VapC
MDEVLIDTNVFSFLLRQKDSRAGLYRSHIQDRIVVLSYVTIGELYFWAERRKWGAERVRLLEEKIRETTVVRYDLEVCRTYARLKQGLRTPSGSHRVMGDNDLWLAACAVRHGIPLITHNRRHFEDIPSLKIVTEAP